MEFQYYMPTKIICGKNCIKNHGAQLRSLGRNAFIVSGVYSAKLNGSLLDMVDALEAVGMEWLHYNKIKPNPSLEEVREAAMEAKKWGADCVIALGGGSPMDAAKAVAVLAAGDVSDETLLSSRSFETVLPLAVVPTTAGTGSEVTPYSILTNTKLETKSFLNSEQVYPKLAFLDAAYMLDLPAEVTAATVVDAMSHAIEGFLAVRAIPLGRVLALESLRIISQVLPALVGKQALTFEDREKLLYGSTLAGMVIAQSGTTAVHAMGYSLTYFKGIDHGVANGYLLPEYFRFISKKRPDEIAELLQAMAIASISEFEKTLSALLGTTALTSEEIAKFAAIASKAGNIQNTFPKPSEEDLKTIMSNSFIK